VRLLIANLQALRGRGDIIKRYMKAYRETVGLGIFRSGRARAVFRVARHPAAIAQRSRDGFFSKQALDPDRIVGLETIVNDAVELKYTTAPLTKEQLGELIQIPPR